METVPGPEDRPPSGHPGRRKKRALFLVGFMGSGKSAVGTALSRRLGWRFEDLDARIEAQQGRSIDSIFRDSGEPAFRRLERDELARLLRELDAQSEVIVALGGGAWVQPDNLQLLKGCGIPAVFLDAPVADLWKRCRADGVPRPLAGNKSDFQRIYALRRTKYLEADVRIETAGKDVETVASEVISWLKLERFASRGEVK